MVKISMVRILLFVLFLSTQVIAQEEWEINQIDDSIFVEKHGEVTWGDKIRFRMVKDNCDVIEHLFTFYTTTNHQDIISLKGKVIPVMNNDYKVGAEILFVTPFLLGHSVWFSLGHYRVDEHVDFLATLDPFSITIIDYENFVAKDFFDISENSWKLTDIKSAMKKGQENCLEL